MIIVTKITVHDYIISLARKLSLDENVGLEAANFYQELSDAGLLKAINHRNNKSLAAACIYLMARVCTRGQICSVSGVCVQSLRLAIKKINDVITKYECDR